MKPLERIAAFVAEHHVMTLATADADGTPHCASLFYAYDPDRNVFVFASDPDTVHARQMAVRPETAAAIHLETETVGKVRGLQLHGRVRKTEAKEDAGVYFSAFPYARVMRPVLWRFEPSWMKLTDNRLGFGKKLVWER
jgi:uncharacterized protein YhbP (UPF0306 family)